MSNTDFWCLKLALFRIAGGNFIVQEDLNNADFALSADLTVHDRGILKKISTSKTEIGSVVPFYVQNNLPSSKFLKIPILGPKWGFFQKVRFWILKLLLKFYFFLKPAGKKSTSPPKPAINVDSKNLPTFENCSKNECIT